MKYAKYFVLSAIFCTPSCLSGKPSKLYFTETRVKFEISAEHQKQVSFPFVVIGNDPIQITKLDSSCGCANPRIELEASKSSPLGSPLPVGQHGKVIVDFIAGAVDQTPRHRPWEETARLWIHHTGENSPIVLSLKGQVRPNFTFVNPTQEHKLKVVRETVPAKINVEVRSHKVFKIEKWNKLPAWLSIAGGESLSIKHDLQVAATADAPRGNYHILCKAETNLGVLLTVPITIQVVNPVDIIPSNKLSLGLGMAQQAERPEKKLEVRSFDPLERMIHTPEVSMVGSDFTYEIKEIEWGIHYDIHIAARKQLPAGRHRSTLTIDVATTQSTKTFEVPVEVVLTR